MKVLLFYAVVILASASSLVFGAQSLDSIQKMEASGDTIGARAALARATQASPNSVPVWTAYAEFLDRYGDPGAREAYGTLLTALRDSGDAARAATVSRRLAMLDLLAGDRIAAETHLAAYRASDGKASSLGTLPPANASANEGTANIPGPLRSFARMAALPPDGDLADVLPALARNVVTNGYQASRSNETLEQTEFLKLVHRYLSQARELEKLSGETHMIKIDNCDSPGAGELLRILGFRMRGETHMIKIDNCDSPGAGELLRILGFRMRGGCGSEVVLETVNAPRAFLTTDSGFPVNDLEQALRTNRPFIYDFHPTAVPVMFGPEYWSGPKDKDKDAGAFIENFISDPSVCRLYLGFSKLDTVTAEAMRKVDSPTRLKAYSHVLDFFGGMFEIRNGKAVVPGGQRSAGAWAELAGASPDQGAAFFDKLMAKDDGWLASLYDALARMHGPVQDYLTEPARMKRFYTAVRGRITSPGPARPVFRSNTDMMLFTTRLRVEPNGKAHIPGSLDVWRNLFMNHPQGKYDVKLTKLAATWKEPDDVLEALFALCRKVVENEPLKIFMAIGDIDRNRPTPLSAATVDRLARDYHLYGSQYPLFSESRSISEPSIILFLDQMTAIGKLKDPALHSALAGTFQALGGLWQILVRQQSIPDAQRATVFSGVVGGFADVHGDRELFDAGRNGVKLLLSVKGPISDPHGKMLDLLAGSPAD